MELIISSPFSISPLRNNQKTRAIQDSLKNMGDFFFDRQKLQSWGYKHKIEIEYVKGTVFIVISDFLQSFLLFVDARKIDAAQICINVTPSNITISYDQIYQIKGVYRYKIDVFLVSFPGDIHIIIVLTISSICMSYMFKNT